MSSPERLSTAKAVWLIARLAMRRQGNMWRSVRLARKQRRAGIPGASGGVRSATPTKSRGRPILSILLFLGLAANGFNIASLGLTRLSATARKAGDSTNRLSVTDDTAARLVIAEKAIKQADQIPDQARREEYEDSWKRYVDQLFLAEVRRQGLSDEEEKSRVQQMHDAFAREGAVVFTRSRRDSDLISGKTWPRAVDAGSVFFRSLALIVLLWMPLIIFGSLGTNSKDLGQVEWNFEWLYTFPVSTRALFVSKLFVYSFLNPLVWVLLLPFLVLVYVSAGLGFMAILVGFAVLLYLSTLAGALTTILEVALRKWLRPSRLKNSQALFTVLGTTCILLIYASGLSKSLDDFLVHQATAMPKILVWNPFTLPLFLGLPSAPAWHVHLALYGMVASLVVFCAFSLIGCEWLTRDGLVQAGGPYEGNRQGRPRRSRGNWLRGVASQEMILLGRDRNLLVQVLIVPLLVPAFYMLIYSGMYSAVSGNFRHAAMMAFGVGAYAFLSSAMQVLNREDKTLWFLLSFPHDLSSILLRKTMVWAGVGLLYGGGVLLALAHFSSHLHSGAWLDAFWALSGIALYAFFAAGIGILATNVFETESRARFKPEFVYLYMILAAMYANILYSPSLWAKVAQLVISVLLAFALWQKVKDLSPYILDPVVHPPPTISLADGLIAGLGFFVAQSLILMLLRLTSDLSLSGQITMAYLIAGLVVSSLALYTLRKRGIADLYSRIGRVVRGSGDAPASAQRSVFYGIALGLVAALGAVVYMHALNLSPEWQVWRRDAELSSFLTRADNPIWISVLMVLAAPLFEEFLFRGLIFQGLRRTAGPIMAVLGSAAVFALIHPPISVIPVFGLGIAAAISFQRCGLLLAPIVAHAVYNLGVILLNRS